MKVGIRTKMLVPTLISVIICMGLASYFSSRKASEEIWGELLSASESITRTVEMGLTNMMEDMQNLIVIQSQDDKIITLLTPEGKEGKNHEEGIAALVATSKFSIAIQGVNLLDAKGDVVASSDPGSKGNFSDRDYFKLAMAGKANISEPVISRITGKPVILIAAPVKNGGSVAGVLYIRVDLGKFSADMVDPVKVGQGGYAFIVDKTGKIVSYPDKTQLLKLDLSQFDWGKKILSMGDGQLEYTFNGTTKTATFKRSDLTGWIVGVTVNADDISKASNAVRNAAMLFGGAGIVLVSLAVMIILHQMIGALKQCVAFAGAVAGGDLENKLAMRRTDEIGSLGDSLRVMVDKLKDMIETANMKTAEAEAQTAVARKAVADAEEACSRAEMAKQEGMVDAATRLEGVVDIATQASEALATEVRTCGRSAQDQSARIGETATAMDQMNATIMEVARNSSEAAETATQARRKAEDGAEIVSQVIKGIGEVETQAAELKSDMGVLGKQAEDIGRIMNVISDIADQTNLLALNAAIEAARAGDAGRGFAVVADEVRKLAEKTMSATKEVGEAIGGIQQGTLKNVKNVERSTRTIEEATALAGRSGESLGEIVSLVELAADQVRSIATAAEEQSSASEEITRSVEDINRISTEVSASMTHASRAVDDLAGQTGVLRGLIKELKSGVGGQALDQGGTAGLKRLA